MEVTCRTFHEKYLLRPSPSFDRMMIGAVGRAQRIYSVPIHQFVVMSNHYHLLVTVESAEQLARFVGYFQSKVAREIGRLHGWREKIWSRRYQAIVVSDEEAAQVERLRYFIQQGVKEGLVSSPRAWPGIHTAKLGVAGLLEGVWMDRTMEYRATQNRTRSSASTFAASETLTITPIPAWRGLTPSTQQDRFAALVAEAEDVGRRLARTSRRPPLGPEAIRRQSPFAKPRAPKRSRAPRFHAATRAVRDAMVTRYRWFVDAYRAASNRFREGRPARFPDNCFLPAFAFLQPGRLLGPAHCCGSP